MRLRLAALVGLLALFLLVTACASPGTGPASGGPVTLAPAGSAPPLPATPAATYVPPPVPTTIAPVPTTTPASVASGPRPRSGAVIDARGSRGEGHAEVENGTDQDGLLTLAQDGRTVRSVYVRANDEATLTGVRDGAYDVYFTTGDGWNAELERFTSAQDYERYPGTSVFRTTKTQYSIWSFTLQPVPDGDVEPQSVAPGDYPT